MAILGLDSHIRETRRAPWVTTETVLADIERYKIDTLYLVPVMYVRMLRLRAATRAKYDVSSLRFVGSTGAYVRQPLSAR